MEDRWFRPSVRCVRILSELVSRGPGFPFSGAWGPQTPQEIARWADATGI